MPSVCTKQTIHNGLKRRKDIVLVIKYNVKNSGKISGGDFGIETWQFQYKNQLVSEKYI